MTGRVALFLSLVVLTTVLLGALGAAVVTSDARATITTDTIRGGTSPWVSGSLSTTTYTGGVSAAYGFPTTGPQPTSGVFTYPHYTVRTRQCPAWAEYSINAGTVTCYYDNVDLNGTSTRTMEWTVRYDSIDASTRTVTYTTLDDEPVRASGSSRFEHDGTTWYVFQGLGVTPTMPLRWDAQIRAPIGAYVKYDVAFIPDSYPATRAGLSDALDDGNLYLQDPFINATDYHVGNGSGAGNAWTDDNGTGTTASLMDGVVRLGIDHQALYTPLAYYSCDASPTVDDSGNGHTVTNNGVSASGTAAVGANSCYYDGSSYGTISPFLPGVADQEYTVTAWVRLNDVMPTPYARLIFANEDEMLLSWELQAVGDLELNQANSAGAWVRTTVHSYSSAGSWQMLSQVHNSTNVWAYVNATPTANTAVSTSYDQADTGVRLGADYSGTPHYMTGYLDEVAFYDTALSQAALSALYNGGTGFNPTSGYVFNPSDNEYHSAPQAIAFNASTFTLEWRADLHGGAVVVNATCDADAGSPSWTLVMNDTVTACPVNGDRFAYVITLSGNATDSPIVQNMTGRFNSVAAPSVNITYVSFTARDVNTSASINAFNVTINGTTYATTNGTAVTGISNNTGPWNFTGESTGYYPRTYNNQDVTSGSFLLELFPTGATPPSPSSPALGDVTLQALIILVLLAVMFLGFFVAYKQVISSAAVVAVLASALLFILTARGNFTAFANFTLVLYTFAVVMFGINAAMFWSSEHR